MYYGRLPELSEALLADGGSNPAFVLKIFASEVADPASSMLAKASRPVRWKGRVFA